MNPFTCIIPTLSILMALPGCVQLGFTGAIRLGEDCASRTVNHPTRGPKLCSDICADLNPANKTRVYCLRNCGDDFYDVCVHKKSSEKVETPLPVSINTEASTSVQPADFSPSAKHLHNTSEAYLHYVLTICIVGILLLLVVLGVVLYCCYRGRRPCPGCCRRGRTGGPITQDTGVHSGGANVNDTLLKTPAV